MKPPSGETEMPEYNRLAREILKCIDDKVELGRSNEEFCKKKGYKKKMPMSVPQEPQQPRHRPTNVNNSATAVSTAVLADPPLPTEDDQEEEGDSEPTLVSSLTPSKRTYVSRNQQGEDILKSLAEYREEQRKREQRADEAAKRKEEADKEKEERQAQRELERDKIQLEMMKTLQAMQQGFMSSQAKKSRFD